MKARLGDLPVHALVEAVVVLADLPDELQLGPRGQAPRPFHLEDHLVLDVAVVVRRRVGIDGELVGQRALEADRCQRERRRRARRAAPRPRPARRRRRARRRPAPSGRGVSARTTRWHAWHALVLPSPGSVKPRARHLEARIQLAAVLPCGLRARVVTRVMARGLDVVQRQDVLQYTPSIAGVHNEGIPRGRVGSAPGPVGRGCLTTSFRDLAVVVRGRSRDRRRAEYPRARRACTHMARSCTPEPAERQAADTITSMLVTLLFNSACFQGARKFNIKVVRSSDDVRLAGLTRRVELGSTVIILR